MNSNTHSPFSNFKRVAEIQAERDIDNMYICPYCTEAATDRNAQVEQLSARSSPIFSIGTFNELKDHILENTDLTDGGLHDQLKDLGDWYDYVNSSRWQSLT